MSFRTVTGFPVAIDHAILARIEYIFAVGIECKFIVLDTEIILLVRACPPPSSRVAEVWTAAHVTLGFIVENPCLAVDSEQRVTGSGN